MSAHNNPRLGPLERYVVSDLRLGLISYLRALGWDTVWVLRGVRHLLCRRRIIKVLYCSIKLGWAANVLIWKSVFGWFVCTGKRSWLSMFRQVIAISW